MEVQCSEGKTLFKLFKNNSLTCRTDIRHNKSLFLMMMRKKATFSDIFGVLFVRLRDGIKMFVRAPYLPLRPRDEAELVDADAARRLKAKFPKLPERKGINISAMY
ncbi:unnamed protein product [Gongylonema pulchrum]|uniref:Sm domain-containing protein n=1 Tax=Gongylonema pulchrum TaxID=637853 RepID=A0A183DAS1_9BILA|nr:unnamed protein product [Gongylonema pulchrum]